MDLSDWEHDLIGVLIISLGIIGLFINGFLLYANVLIKSQTVESNGLVVNLSLSNIGIIVMAFPLSGLASLKHSWIWGDGWCTYYGSIALVFGFNMMITVLMLAIDVFLKYNHANYEQNKHRARKLMILWAWVNSLFWGLAPLVGWSRISYEPSGTSCTVDVKNPDTAYISYIVMCAIWIYAIPILFMIVIGLRTRDNVKYATDPKEMYSELRQIFLLLVLFILEWTPYTIIYLWPILKSPETIPMRLSAAAPVISKFAVVLTPLVFMRENCAKLGPHKD